MYELSTIIASVRRRLGTAIALFFAIAIVGCAAVLIFRSYAVSSQVLIKRPDTLLQTTNYPQIDALLSWNRDTAIETYVAMALEPSLVNKMIEEVGLPSNAKKFIKWHLTVTPVTHSDIINIQVTWRNADLAAAAANTLARDFVEKQRVLSASQASDAAASLSIALRKAQIDVANAERELTLFESRHEVADASTQTSSIINAISDVQAKERGVDAERVQAQGQLADLTAQIQGVPATVNASTTIGVTPAKDQIEQQLVQQRMSLELLRRQFTDKYPEVIATESQIAGLEAELARTQTTRVASKNIEPNPLSTSLVSQASTLKAQVTGNLAQLDVLRSQEDDLRNQLRTFPADLTELASLQRRAKSAETIYDALQTNYFNAVVAKSMAVSDLSVVSEADPAVAKNKPPLTLSFLAIGVIAILGAVGWVSLLDRYRLSALALREAG